MNNFRTYHFSGKTTSKKKLRSTFSRTLMFSFVVLFTIITFQRNSGIRTSNCLSIANNTVYRFPDYQTFFNQSATKPRMLQEDSHVMTSVKNWESQSMQTNVYIVVLIIGLCVLGIGVFICLSIILYKCFIEPYLDALRARGLLSNGNKIANINSDFMELIDIVAPELSYQIFLKEVGKPLHENCVICLEEFESNIDSNTFPSEDNKHKSKILLTICGHILHSKCLKEWMDRQRTCPLCREQLNNSNISLWQQKIGINLKEIYQHYLNEQKQFEERKKADKAIDNLVDELNVMNKQKKQKNKVNNQNKQKIRSMSSTNNIRTIHSLETQIIQANAQHHHYNSTMSLNITKINNKKQQLQNNTPTNHAQQRQKQSQVNAKESIDNYSIMILYAIKVYRIFMNYQRKLEKQGNEIVIDERITEDYNIFATKEKKMKGNVKNISRITQQYPQEQTLTLVYSPENREEMLTKIQNQRNNEENYGKPNNQPLPTKLEHLQHNQQHIGKDNLLKK